MAKNVSPTNAANLTKRVKVSIKVPAKKGKDSQRGMTAHTTIADGLGIVPKGHQFITTESEVSNLNLIGYHRLYKKAVAADESFVIYATPKLRFLLTEAMSKKAHEWLLNVVISKYPTTASQANNLGRGIRNDYLVFLSETGRYDKILSQALAATGNQNVMFVSRAGYKELAEKRDDNQGIGRGLNKPTAYKPSDFSNLDVEGKIKAFKDKHGTTASKEDITAFIVQVSVEFGNMLGEALWEAGVFGQDEKHVKVSTESLDGSFARKLPTHIGGVSEPHNRSNYVGWHYVVEDISELPFDNEGVLPGMTALVSGKNLIYIFSDDHKWEMDADKTLRYSELTK